MPRLDLHILFLLHILLYGTWVTTSQATPKSSRSQQLEKRLNQFVIQRLQQPRTRSKNTIPSSELQRWNTLLQQIPKQLHLLPLPLLQKLHNTLRLELDLDRQRYKHIPQRFQRRVRSTLHHIQRQLRKYKPKRPRSPQKHPSQKHSTQKHSSPRLHKHSHHATDRGVEIILGNEKPTPSMFPLPKRRRSKAHHHNTPESELPPLLLTERDLARVSEPKRFFFRPPIPGAKITSGYGWRRDPFTQQLRFHHGIDFRAPFGTSIYAAAAGRVIRSRWMGSCGMGILIRHKYGFYSYYCHLSQLLAPQRTYVKQGALIGKSGSTGRSTAPHLHFTILRNGRTLNPRTYLKKRKP